jgi:glycosyltransferase involved in cell wall biosynthesis
VPAAELILAAYPTSPTAQPALRSRLAALAALVERHGVGDRVRLLPQAAGTLRQLLDGVHVVACTGRYAPPAHVALEAMAAGLPVVLTDAGAHPDVVLDHVTGDLVPPGSPASLAAALRNLLADPVRMQSYGVAAADRVRSAFSWDRIAAATLRSYERLLSVPATGPLVPSG